MNATPRDAGLCALVLAAGTSSRFGATKLLQIFRGKPLLNHALLAAQQAFGAEVYLTVGHDRQAIAAAAEHYDHLVVNVDYEAGIGTSIAAAIRACPAETDAAVVMLADQPLITASHLRRLLDAWSGKGNEIVATSFDEVSGPPILFPRQAFSELAKLTGDEGARSLQKNPKFTVKTVDFPNAAFDIDRPEDLARQADDSSATQK